MKFNLLPILLLFLFSSVIFAEEKSYKIDLDMDGDFELITVEQKSVMIKDSKELPTEAKIMVFSPDGKPNTFSIPDKIKNIEFISLNKDGKKQIVAWSSGQGGYTNLAIYRYKYGRLSELFRNGSIFPIKAELAADKPTIKVGRANLEQKGDSFRSGEPLWQVYIWNGRRFIFNKKLSTTTEISEEEEVSRYLKKVEKLSEDLYKQVEQLIQPLEKIKNETSNQGE